MGQVHGVGNLRPQKSIASKQSSKAQMGEDSIGYNEVITWMRPLFPEAAVGSTDCTQPRVTTEPVFVLHSGRQPISLPIRAGADDNGTTSCTLMARDENLSGMAPACRPTGAGPLSTCVMRKGICAKKNFDQSGAKASEDDHSRGDDQSRVSQQTAASSAESELREDLRSCRMRTQSRGESP